MTVFGGRRDDGKAGVLQHVVEGSIIFQVELTFASPKDTNPKAGFIGQRRFEWNAVCLTTPGDFQLESLQEGGSNVFAYTTYTLIEPSQWDNQEASI